MNHDLGIFLLIGLLFALATVLVMVTMALRFKQRELQHRERMTALEKGAALPALSEPARQPAPFHPRTLLLRGLLWLFTGIAITTAAAGMALLGQHQEPAWFRVSQANNARSMGASEAQVLQIMNDRHSDGPNPGIALIGLIPIGVGLAYLITWRSERSGKQ
ncbi:MAG: hypothetical protein ABSH47_04030 [Bryobacteraceae bacterium]|jgi:hypothetical protein